LLGNAAEAGRTFALDELTLLPASQPTKIVCVGSNYREHCDEMGRPVPTVPKLFLKPPSALLAHGQPIQRPDVGRVDFEGELAVVIGRRATRVSTEQALDYVLGYSIVNDVTARDIQRSEIQFTRAKGFDTFCPLGPRIASVNPLDVGLSTRVNGELRQDSRTSDMIFSVPELLSFISHVMTLESGDVVSTGTPSGVGPVNAGDTISISVEGVGTLTNTVEEV